MNLKKKLKKFFTLSRTTNGGFTLVELIVVIAILGILAGVGTVGYSGYIKHANKKADVTTIKGLTRTFQTAGNSYAYELTSEQASAEGLQIPVGFVILSDQPFVINADGTATITESGKYLNFLMTDGNEANEAVLRKMLEDAYGPNYEEQLMLKSNIWQGSNIPTLYADAGEMFGQIQDMSELLYSVKDVDIISSRLSRNDFESDVEIVANIATVITNKYTEDQFVQKWIAADGHRDGTSYAFELNDTGLEVYTAVRAAYNEGVASYIEKYASGIHTTTTYSFTGWSLVQYRSSKDYWSTNNLLVGYSGYDKNTSAQEDCTVHTGLIRDFGDPVLNMVVSDTIQSRLFSSDASGYTSTPGYKTTNMGYSWTDITVYKENAGDLADNLQLCTTCAGLVGSYCASSEAVEDAKAFYKTMQTLASTADEAMESGDGWAYYNNYVNDFSGLYADIESIMKTLSANGSCVVFTIYYNESAKLLTVDVSLNVDEY